MGKAATLPITGIFSGKLVSFKEQTSDRLAPPKEEPVASQEWKAASLPIASC